MKNQSHEVRDTGVAAALRAEAARLGISGREIARRLGVTPVYVARRFSGEVDCSSSDLQRFAEILGVPVATFFGETAGARRRGAAA